MPAQQRVEASARHAEQPGSLRLVVVAPLAAWWAGTAVSVVPQAERQLFGLFVQAGLGHEEALFRGYLFNHLRRGRSFWGAAWLSMVPFAVVHLWLFVTMPAPVAAAALLLSCVAAGVDGRQRSGAMG